MMTGWYSDMKAKMLFAISALAASVMACNKETVDNAQPEETLVTFGIEQPEIATKTDLYGTYTVNWADGDVILLNCGSYEPFTLRTGAGTRVGTFGNSEGKVYQNEISSYSTSAWYPETTNPTWKDGSEGSGWYITIPAEYTWSEQGLKAPMMAYLSTEHPTWQSFSVLTGILKVDVSDIPANANKLVFTAPGKKVSGDFMFYEEGGVRKLKTSDSGSNNTITISFDAGSATFRSFIIPVPEGTYTNFTLQFYEDASAIAGTGRRSSITVGAKEVHYLKPYSCSASPADTPERVIWAGNFDAGDWSGMADLQLMGSFFTSLTAGQRITVYGTEDITDGSTWIGVGIKGGGAGWPAFDPEQYTSWRCGAGTFAKEFVLTSSDVTTIKDGGLIAYGYKVTITKITLRDAKP